MVAPPPPSLSLLRFSVLAPRSESPNEFKMTIRGFSSRAQSCPRSHSAGKNSRNFGQHPRIKMQISLSGSRASLLSTRCLDFFPPFRCISASPIFPVFFSFSFFRHVPLRHVLFTGLQSRLNSLLMTEANDAVT